MEISESNEDYYELYPAFNKEHFSNTALEKVYHLATAAIQAFANLFIHAANGTIAAKKFIVGDVCLSCWMFNMIESSPNLDSGTKKS
jgi:hypothetical protein